MLSELHSSGASASKRKRKASCIFPSRMKLEIFGYLAWETKGERKKQTLEEASGPASASAPKHKRRVIKTLD